MSSAYARKRSVSTRARVLAAALTLVTIVLGILDGMAFLSLVVHPLAHTYTKPLTWRLWDNITVIVFVITWLVLVYASAYAYQRAVERGTLWSLFAKVTAVQIVVPVLAIAATRLIILFVEPPPM
jgi:hypothetical protein